LIKELVLAGGRNNRYVYPLVSIFSEQYARVYVTVLSSKKTAKEHIGYIVIDQEGYQEVVSPSDILERPFIGPIWIGPLHDKFFIEKMLDIVKKLELEDSIRNKILRILNMMSLESELPSYTYKLSSLASKLKVLQPSVERLLDSLKKEGYLAGRSHMGKDLIKTNAPLHVLEELLLLLGRK
jgi:tRNA (guanine26-N2/guanine27-N2)-dimethyltransferase